MREFVFSFTAAKLQYRQNLIKDEMYREINCLPPLKCKIFLSCNRMAKFASGFWALVWLFNLQRASLSRLPSILGVMFVLLLITR